MAKLSNVKTLDMQNGEVTKVEYNGEVYAKVDGQAHVGDLLLNNYSHADVTLGAFYAVVKDPQLGITTIIDDAGDGHSNVLSASTVFRKVNATAETLSVGDTVKLTIADGERPKNGWGSVKNGEVGKVKAIYDRKIVVDFPSQSSWNALHSELTKIVAEPAGEAYALVTDREPKVGDFVKFTDEDELPSYLTFGKYYEIIEIDLGDPVIKDDDGDEYDTHGNSFEVYAQFLAVEHREVKREAKVGELIKIVAAYGASGYKDGDVRKVTQVNPQRPGIRATVLIEPDNAKVLTREYVVLEPVAEGYEVIDGKLYRNLGAVDTQKGDYVKFHGNHDFTKAGKLYRVIDSVDSYASDGGYTGYSTKGWGGKFQRDVFRLVDEPAKLLPAETITHNGATYTLVDRKAQPGDVVVFTESRKGYAKNGKPYLVDDRNEITDEDNDRIAVYNEGPSYNRTPANVKVYAPVAAEKPSEPKLRVGDFARALKASKYGSYSDGAIVVIRDVNFHGQLVARGFESGVRNGVWQYGELVRATDEEVATAKAELEFAKFSEGDKVHLVSGGDKFPLQGFSDGKVYEVKSPKFTHETGEKVQLSRDGGIGYALPIQLEKLSAEEVEKIQAEQAEVEKWAVIGRKPNEFKKGDIVRAVDTSATGLESGHLAVIVSVDRDGDVFTDVKNINGVCAFYTTDRIELITPVEARFDA